MPALWPVALDPAGIAAARSGPGRLKTWSLIVTYFGDSVMPKGGMVSAAELGEVMSAIGIEPGAVRTALSRLAKEGWIARSRTGRASFYRLKPDHARAFEEAARKIYGNGQRAEGTPPPAWTLVRLDPANDAGAPVSAGLIQVSRGLYLSPLGPEALTCPADALVVTGTLESVPPWLQGIVAPAELGEAMRRLITIFAPVRNRIRDGARLESLDALAIRTLLIHEWRRIALKLPPPAPGLMPEDWPERECRELVGDLRRLLSPAP